MDFSIGEDRQILVDSFSRFLGDKADFAARLSAIKSAAGFDRALWTDAAELGVLGALFSEDAGGFGGTALDIGVVFQQIGRGLAVGPFLASLLAGKCLEAAGDADMLEALISGEKIWSFAHDDAVGSDGAPSGVMRAEGQGDSWHLTGSKGVVDFVDSADMAVVTAEMDGDVHAFCVDMAASGVTRRGYGLIDGGNAGELILDKVPARLLCSGKGVADAIAAGLTAVSWESLGVMEILRDSTLEYLRTRKQFGIPIGKFQALQHRMATVALEIEQMRSAATNAVVNFDKGSAERDRFCAAAKYSAARIGRLTAEEAVQMHGGIGMTWELPLSHYVKRLIMLNQIMGDEDTHLMKYSRLAK